MKPRGYGAQGAHPTTFKPVLEIWADRGDGKGFAFLAIDSQPNYPDTTAPPVAGQSALWKYKAIYRLADEQVGQWSDVISTTVAG